jgi:hypothetical protein
VYRAVDPNLGEREVALKVAPARGKEAEIQGRLDHAHIVPVLSVTPADPQTGLRGLCMPYRSGLSLDEVIRWIEPASKPKSARVFWDALAAQSRALWEHGPADEGWLGFPIKGSYAEGVAWIILVLARALLHAHRQEILHRDVKPANVLLTLRDGPQLLDFNLAHDPHHVDAADAALRGGTLPYMSPEQLMAFLDPERWRDVGPQADLYGLGLLLHELFTGERPEPPDPDLPLPRAIREILDRRMVAARSLRQINASVPYALDSITTRLLAYTPPARYATAEDLTEDLERFLAHKPLKYAPNVSRAELARGWVRRRRVPLAVAAALAVVLPISGWLFGKDPNPADTYVNHAKHYIETAAELNGQAGKEELFKLAEQQLESAVALDRDLYSIYQNLASIAFQRGNRAKEYDCLTLAIEAAMAKTAKRRPTPVNLTWLYEMHGTTALHLAQRRLSSVRDQKGFEEANRRAFLAATPYYSSAKDDFQRARDIGKFRNTLVKFNVLAGLARAEMGLGDVASFFDLYENSVPHYETASQFLAQAMALPFGVTEAEEAKKYGYMKNAESTKRDIELRLSVDGPKRDLLRRQIAERLKGATGGALASQQPR